MKGLNIKPPYTHINSHTQLIILKSYKIAYNVVKKDIIF